MPIPAGVTASLWLEADGTVLNGSSAAAANGDAVATWTDTLSGSTKSATQGTSGNRPTFVTNIVNGNPAIQFATSKSVDIATFVLSQPFLIGMVFNITSGTNAVDQCIYDSTSSSSRVIQGPALNGGADTFQMGYFAGIGTGVAPKAATDYPKNAWHWTEAYFSDTKSQLLQELVPIIGNGTTSPGTNNLATFKIGCRYTQDQGLVGYLALIYILNAWPNALGHCNLANYIGPKYGISNMPSPPGFIIGG